MSARTYQLRTRAGVATQPRTFTVSTVHGAATIRDPAPEPPRPTTDASPALYSDVAASRPPSPQKETVLPLSSQSVANEGADEPQRSMNDKTIVSNHNDNVVEKPPYQSEWSGPSGEDDGEPWTTVQRRRTRSLGSLDRAQNTNNGPPVIVRLTAEQNKAVKVAASQLTDEQRYRIQQRHQNVQIPRESSLSSRGEGTSKQKGKTIDPKEWGNVNLSKESLDIETQAAALQSFKQHKRDGKKKRNGPGQGKPKSAGNERLAESQPAAQIAPKSYLGAALRNIDRSKGKRRKRSPSSSPSDKSSSSSDTSQSEDSLPSEDDDSESETSESSYRARRRKRNRHGRKKRSRKVSSSSTSKIKPIPPKNYDGAADARAYHRFVRESEAYLRDGRVKGHRKVFLLSYYLNGKAYDFYTQKVSMNEEEWTLPQFYTELFNYCFPVDYRMQMR